MFCYTGGWGRSIVTVSHGGGGLFWVSGGFVCGWVWLGVVLGGGGVGCCSETQNFLFRDKPNAFWKCGGYAPSCYNVSGTHVWHQCLYRSYTSPCTSFDRLLFSVFSSPELRSSCLEKIFFEHSLCTWRVVYFVFSWQNWTTLCVFFGCCRHFPSAVNTIDRGRMTDFFSHCIITLRMMVIVYAHILWVCHQNSGLRFKNRHLRSFTSSEMYPEPFLFYDIITCKFKNTSKKD